MLGLRLDVSCLSLLLLAACGSSTPASTGGDDAGGAGGSAGSGPGSDAGQTGPEEDFEVGFDVTDISPTDAEIATGTLYLGAYGILTQRGEALGVHDSIFARAMVITSGQEALALAILDLPGMGNRPMREIRAGVADRTGIDPDRVLVGVTHTHSAPDFQGLWGGIPVEYRNRVIALTIDALSSAYERRASATLSVARGEHENNNRRDWPFTDQELTVLDATDDTGARVGTLIQFSAHPVTVGRDNREVSRDYTGYLVDHAESVLGAPVLYFNGIIGDCSPAGTGSEFDRAEDYGTSIANQAIDVLSGAARVSSGLGFEPVKFRAPVTNGRFELAYRAGILDYDADDTPGDLGVDTQSAIFRLGSEVSGIAFPGESVTRHGLPIKDTLDTPFRLFFGLTTDTLGYFIPSDEWESGRNGAYEETLSMGEVVGDLSQQLLMERIGVFNDTF